MRITVPFVSLVTLFGAACSSQGSANGTETNPLTGAPTASDTTTSPQTPPPSSVTTPAPNNPTPSPKPTPPPAAPSGADESTDVTADEGSVTLEPSSSVADETSAPPPADDCIDVPDPEFSCAQRKEWGNCDQQWLIDADYCALTCGRCTPGSNPGGNPGGNPSTPTPPPPGNNPAQPDNRFPPINGGGDGHATRYWDCAKPSCGWSNNAGGRPVRSCDRDGNNLGPTEAKNGFEGGGTAFTCMSWAPFAKDEKLAFGFAATHTNSTCGKCYQLQFTGQGQHTANDAGSVAIKDKTMVVMATNIGGDVASFQLDTLIPGGGVGAINACGNQGVPAAAPGAQQQNYGGFLAECKAEGKAGDLNAQKECVRSKCNTAFGDAKFADLKAGCLWYVDWYQTADNPKFWSKEVECPQELTGIAY